MEGRLGQAATLNGLEGISPGRDIELIPYSVLRGFHALDTRDPLNPYFQKATAQGQPGMDGKFVFNDHFTLDLTANPDFSQVESEDPQITVNQRYAVYFPEKRPFFLENEDFFRTPMNLFFTRNIGAPSAGIRLTGKDGPYSVGLMSTDDRSPGLAVPDYNAFSGHPFLLHRRPRKPRHLPPVERRPPLHRLGMPHHAASTTASAASIPASSSIRTGLSTAQAVTSSSNIFGNFFAPTYSPTTAKPMPSHSVPAIRATATTTPDRPSASNFIATACTSPTTESTTTSAPASSPCPASSIAWTSAKPIRRSITASARAKAGSWIGAHP